MFKKKAQTTTEYIMLVVIVIGALLTIATYVKRGLQGRWKSGIDSLGDQYDPTVMQTDITYSVNGTTNTAITTVKSGGGYWTKKVDKSESTQRTTGQSSVLDY